MPPLESQQQQELIRLIRETTEAHRETIRSLSAIDRSAQASTAQLEQLAAQLANLEKVVFRGNGNPSLTIQIVTFKEELKALRTHVDHLREDFEGCGQSHRDSDKDKRMWIFNILTLLVAALAFISQVWPHIFHAPK